MFQTPGAEKEKVLTSVEANICRRERDGEEDESRERGRNKLLVEGCSKSMKHFKINEGSLELYLEKNEEWASGSCISCTGEKGGHGTPTMLKSGL